MNVAKIKNLGAKEYHIANYIFSMPKTKEEKRNFHKYIKTNNIDTLINVSDFPISVGLYKFYRSCGLSVIYAPFQDKILIPKEYPLLKKHLQDIWNETKYSGNMLVHCTAGVNRSASVISYIAYKNVKIDMGYIIQKIREANFEKRNIKTLTNFTFENFLRNYC